MQNSKLYFFILVISSFIFVGTTIDNHRQSLVIQQPVQGLASSAISGDVENVNDEVILPPIIYKLDQNTAQILVLHTSDINIRQGVIDTWEKTNGHWKKKLSPIKVVLGINGLRTAEKKKEGDGCTPEGVYKLQRAFGYFPISTKLAYTQLTENNFWIDDSDSPQYNLLVENRPLSGTYEIMKRNDNLYKVGIVIEYNTDPIITGKGSAIFIHVWRNMDSPTSGCIAMSEENVNALLAWLDPDRNPLIVLNGD